MFGKKIKNLRQTLSMTQIDVAKSLGVTKQSVSNWETNNIYPTADILKKMAVLFNCSTDYLLGLERNTFCVSTDKLTDEQIAIILNLISQFENLNRKSEAKRSISRESFPHGNQPEDSSGRFSLF